MLSSQGITVPTQLIYQIKGLGNSVLSLDLGITFGTNIHPKPSSLVLAEAKLYSNSSPSPIVVTQQLPASSIILSPDGTHQILNLEGTLYIGSNEIDLDSLTSSASIYYIQ
ncbi:MAG: hypothetical protein ACRCWY_12645 [Cellulosilyticaceae bacterium]